MWKCLSAACALRQLHIQAGSWIALMDLRMPAMTGVVSYLLTYSNVEAIEVAARSTLAVLDPTPARTYIVQMQSYSVSSVRQNIAKALDEAEGGRDVAIVRRGVRFRLVVDRTAKSAHVAKSFVELLDPTLLEGGWHWDIGADGDLVLQLRDSGVPNAMPKKRRVARPKK
jgi:hypothetical protein